MKKKTTLFFCCRSLQLGARKGLGATKIQTNFEDIEREAQLADSLRSQKKAEVPAAAPDPESQVQPFFNKQKKNKKKLGKPGSTASTDRRTLSDLDHCLAEQDRSKKKMERFPWNELSEENEKELVLVRMSTGLWKDGLELDGQCARGTRVNEEMAHSFLLFFFWIGIR